MEDKNSIENLQKRLEELEKRVGHTREIEEKLNEREESFDSLIHNIPGIVYRCECEKDWKMSFISDSIEEFTGYPASDFIDEKVRKFSSIIYPDDRAMVEEIIFHAVEKRESYTVEYRIVDKNGRIHWVYERGRGIFKNGGKAQWLDGAIFDITDKKNSEEEKDQLLHELKEALDKINTLSGMLPICAKCSKVRDEKGSWSDIEHFVEEHSLAHFSHSLCPDCVEKLYGKKEWFKKRMSEKDEHKDE